MGEWHSRPVSRILKELDSRPGGLSDREAAQRLEKVGPNELEPPKRPSMLVRILGQLKDPMILV
ncbi:MAG: cation-transporting P-type ATPase, partial [Lawsonibacter sp.]